MTKIKEVITPIELLAPLSYQEEYDNCGFQTGNPDAEVQGVLLTLDCTEAVIEEAIAERCNLIISHHPVIFGRGLKKLIGASYAERIIMKAIRNNITIYSAHTNLDNVDLGVNSLICRKLNLSATHILAPKSNILSKIVTFAPVQHADAIRSAMFNAGAGNIGNYADCSFNITGTGTFKANELAKPFVGMAGKLHREQEVRMEMIFPTFLKSAITSALLEAHPYEEVAFDIYPLENTNRRVGSGSIGLLPSAMEEGKFLEFLKSTMKTKCIRHTPLLGKPIHKVAVCGGAGSFLLEDAIRQGADVFVTGDYKYHGFFDADGKILIADIGHYESEQFTPELFAELLNKNFSTFAIRLSKINTNPVNYL